MSECLWIFIMIILYILARGKENYIGQICREMAILQACD
jgi:hypothetical protein